MAEQGWEVTAVDPSRVALERAEAAALAAGVDVTWVHAGLLAMPDGTGEHDLVSAQYTVLPAAGGDAVAALLGAVAPGGTLVFVHHDVAVARAEDHGGDTADLVMPNDVRAALGDDWVVEVDEVRERPAPPEVARHSHDVVLRARRLG